MNSTKQKPLHLIGWTSLYRCYPSNFLGSRTFLTSPYTFTNYLSSLTLASKARFLITILVEGFTSSYFFLALVANSWIWSSFTFLLLRFRLTQLQIMIIKEVVLVLPDGFRWFLCRCELHKTISDRETVLPHNLRRYQVVLGEHPLEYIEMWYFESWASVVTKLRFFTYSMRDSESSVSSV